MSQLLITELTLEQEELIPIYLDKWLKIAFPKEQIDRQEAEAAIKFAYDVLGLKQPHILFFSNPINALKHIFNQEVLDLDNDMDLKKMKIKVKKVWGKSLVNRLRNQLVHPMTYNSKNQRHRLATQINNQLVNPLRVPIYRFLSVLDNQIAFNFKDSWGKDSLNHICKYLYYYWLVIKPEEFCLDALIVDFYISALNGSCNQLEWKTLFDLITSCGWIFPFDKICLVCDRPIQISFDEQYEIYTQDKALILYPDGYSVDKIYI